jgi:hypothetical protein
MNMAIVVTFSLAIWIVLWSIGTKAIDGFMLVALVLLIAAMVKVLAQYLPKRS